MRTHSDAVNAVRCTVSELGGISMKYTVGLFKQMDGDRLVKIGQPGVTDIIACIDGVFFGIEVKFTDGDSVSPDQEKFREALERAGGKWILADFRRGQGGCEVVRKGVQEWRGTHAH